MADWKNFRRQFPVTEKYAYLNNAGIAPLSTPGVQAMQAYLDEISEHGAARYSRLFDDTERVRKEFAALIGADGDEIAFVSNTSDGLSLVANGISWRPGDRVLVPENEFPANVYPWLALEAKGVQVERIPFIGGRCPVEAIAERLPGARLLALSAVTFSNGYRFDVEALGKLCREHDVRFCVDAIQALGALPVDVRTANIDYLAADGHKWLVSPEGAACFYIARERIAELKPSKIGWRNVRNEFDFSDIDLTYKSNAGRFEEGSYNLPGLLAFGASLRLLNDLGVPAIAARIRELGDYLVAGLQDLGYHVRSPRNEGEWSGIISFRGDESDRKRLSLCLEKDVVIAYRDGALRASPHAYNNENDIDRLLDVLAAHPPV